MTVERGAVAEQGGGVMPSSEWLELELERADAGVRVRARGSRGEQPAPLLLGPGFQADSLERFSAAVRAAAARGEPLGEEWLERARGLHRALFREDLQTVLARLHEVADGDPILLRWMLHEGELQAIPWEALCEPGTASGFLASSPKVLPARGVYSAEPWKPREVAGAVRVLPVAPSGGAALTVLRAALAQGIAAGEIEWLEPLTGARARWLSLASRLACKPFPHVIHFIGHGALEQGTPRLCLGDADDEGAWIHVERLGQQLQEELRRYLRLIVLDACEGARPGVLANAAELLARAGADAVVAHLWPVKADVARTCSAAFYRMLTGAGERRGDVARALNHARRMVLATSGDGAEAFSPVLYLRGRDSVLFEFKDRRVSPPRPPASDAREDPPSPALRRLLERPFTLLLGDKWKDERLLLEGFRERLRQVLANDDGTMPPGLPLSALTEQYELRYGEDNLNTELQEVFGSVGLSSPLIAALARRLAPGVHITLLRLPVLELALAEQRPELTLYAIQPPGPGARPGTPGTMMRREAGAEGWTRLHALPRLFDSRGDLVVLRLYSGYSPMKTFRRPLITEDDYLLGIHELKELRPPELYDFIAGRLHTQPVLLMGMSMMSWHHRMLLYRLFEMRTLPHGSGVLLEPGAGELERNLWASGQCLPGRGGVDVFGPGPTELGAP